jgi:hypothetical protein
MSNNLLEDKKITASGATAGVQTLATRPNQPSMYGIGSLSATELKKRFDRLADSIISKYNDLCETLGGADALKHIQWKEEKGDIKTLADFFATITNGDFAKSLQIPSVEGESSTALTEVLAAIMSDLISIKAMDAVLKNPPGGGTQSINSPLEVVQLTTEGYASFGSDVDVTHDLSIGNNLYVKGTAYTVHQQSVVVWDNIIVTNAYTSETGVVDFLLSGLVIDTGDGAYGILYKPGDDAVVIGKGTLTKTTDSEGNVTDVEFEYGEGQALPLAARDYSFTDSEIPMWDAEKNAFVSSGKNIGNIVEDALGDIDTALNSILAIQNNLIGGAT